MPFLATKGFNTNLHAFFYKLRQAEISKKIKLMLSNNLRLNFCYLKIIHILYPPCHSRIMGHILKNKQKNKCVCLYSGNYTINHHENEDENEK